jgi:hypothetical protein
MAASEGTAPGVALSALARQVPETTSVARVAMRAARIAGGGADDDQRIARALVVGVSGRAIGEVRASGPLDLDLFESDPPVADLVARLTRPGGEPDWSVLLAGPPGTGKTQLAGEVAERLGRALVTRRASDLMSKWVGETEQNIAQAFRDSIAEGAVLMFDEADSLLYDRATATRSWEVSQVNELLTWLDHHPLPVFAATNELRRLDPAALRRFTFKLNLRPLGAVAARQAFARFFDQSPPVGLDRLAGLTPGDFAVVARQLRASGSREPAALLAALEAELAVKPGTMAVMGF